MCIRDRLNAVPLARLSTEVAFAISTSAVPVGGIGSYEIATKMALSSPEAITLDPDDPGACEQVTGLASLRGNGLLSGVYHWNAQSLTMGPYDHAYAYGTSHCSHLGACGHKCTSWSSEHHWALCFQGQCMSGGATRMQWHFPNGDGQNGAVAIWFR